ncbi:FadR/GntR family transcriptional regulator [Pseudonocardia sp.]|jgi:DNA-binding FadR family transcriptional regulator|uniref:FadR/GntR family transcriptional regulator n=1 Tax=Pseudonocardia sp. TaxID=60912 RepID=UPI003D0D99AA
MANGVTTQTLTEVVADHLRRLIHLGEVGPGDRLPAERELAEQLGIARLSLREALKTLQNDGYVEVRRGARGGTYVTELEVPVARWRARMRTESGEFDDIIDFRIGLETETARLAAARRTPEDLAALRATIDDLTVAHDRTAFRLTDSRFHAALARAARSSRLGAAVETTRAELFNTHDLLPFIDPVQESVDDHQAVFRAVEAGDVDAAAAAMRDHIEHTRTQLRAIVFATDPLPTEPAS